MGDWGGPGRHGGAPRVFISYRRDLSFDVAGRLRDTIERERPGSTFQDVESLRAGRDWATQLDDALGHEGLRCFVLVVGRDFWTHPGPTPGDPLLWRADDPVLHEIDLALRRAEAEPDTFRVLVVLHDTTSRLPTFGEQTAPGVPATTASVIERIRALHVDHRARLDSAEGIVAVADRITAAVIEAGAEGFRAVRTLADLYALDATTRRAVALGAQRTLATGSHDHRSTVLLALVRILDHDHDAAAKALDPLSGSSRSRVETAVAAAVGEGRLDDAYWAAMVQVVTVITALRGERPRRLDSLVAARDLVVERLLPAVHAFDRIAGALRADPTAGALPSGVRMAKAGPATVTPADVDAGLQLAVALARAIVTDYFRSRGVLVMRSGPLESALETTLADRAQRTNADALVRWLQQEGYLASWPPPPQSPQPTPPYAGDPPNDEDPRGRA